MTYSVAIIGAGLMGAGLVRLFDGLGWAISIYDANPAALAVLQGARIGASLADAVAGVDLVIEAASEKLPVKQAIFAELAAATGAGTILATNSSVIPVGAITAHLDDTAAARSVGTHFWNPPDVIPLVEVIAGLRTGAAAIASAMAMLVAAGKEPVHVRRDVVPGNRLQHALWREAIALVEEGVCAPQDVDHIIKRSFGLRLPVLGPLENADLVGLTLTAQIHDIVLPLLSQATSASPAIAERIARGDLGIASGAGFYPDWTEEKVAALRSRLTHHLTKILAEEQDA